MSVILNIETSGSNCSVSLCRGGELLGLKETDEGYTHAENLHVFIREVLANAGVALSTLSAVAVSSGPGSYTGLRIGVSAAKGLAYTLNIPLISVDTLKLISFSAKQKNAKADYYCPLIDARRMEVYTALFDKELNSVKPTEALVVSEQTVHNYAAHSNIAFFGDGMNKCRTLLQDLPGAIFIDGIKPGATLMGKLSYSKLVKGEVENTAYYEPFYLKEFYIKGN